MEILSDLLKIVLPAGLVLYAVYLTVTSILTKDVEKRMVDLKIRKVEITLPLRLQAYERVCLLLERISPGSILIRMNDPSADVREFQSALNQAIRDEFSHNLSQQVYMSAESWNLVRSAMEDLISIVNTSAQNVHPEAPSFELSRAILERIMHREEDPTTKALKFIKAEIAKEFS